MKNIVLVSAAMVMLGSYAANAENLYIGIGNPAPAYVVAPPPPAYVVQPAGPAVVYYPSHYHKRHYYDWQYWHNHSHR